MTDEVHKLTLEVARPRGDFPGRVVIGYYCVSDGHVVLTDENGKPTGDDKRYLNPGGDAKVIACSMLRKSRRNGASVRGFNDRIFYPKLKY
jgi:hypothetical protein